MDRMVREVVLDTETTGLNPANGDKIIEIGALELLDHVPTGIFFHVYLNPERKIPYESVRIHKITDAFVANKPLFRDVANDLLSFINNSLLVIHNAEFDLKFLNNELEINNLPKLDSPIIDTLALAKEKYPGSSASLDSLCKRFHIDITARKKGGHGALTDSILLADVYLEILGGKQPKLRLESNFETKKDEVVDFLDQTEKVSRPNPLTSRLSKLDKEKHQKFVRSIGCEKAWKLVYLDQDAS